MGFTFTWIFKGHTMSTPINQKMIYSYQTQSLSLDDPIRGIKREVIRLKRKENSSEVKI
jgi:hypothetical protein